jgi:hypothetical protein
MASRTIVGKPDNLAWIVKRVDDLLDIVRRLDDRERQALER